MQFQFLAPVELFFKQLNGCSFVMSAFVSGMEHSTIVESQRLGAVHIVECTCSRLVFFRVVWAKNDTDMYMNTDMFIYTCERTRASFFFFVLWCRVMSCVARRCGVVLSACRCRGGLCPCVVVPLIDSS